MVVYGGVDAVRTSIPQSGVAPLWVEAEYRDAKGYKRGTYLCFCGAMFSCLCYYVEVGKRRGCGCLRRQAARERGLVWGRRQIGNGSAVKHGHSRVGSGLTPTYQSWAGMKQRCRDVNASNYRYYGARGVEVCGRWKDYAVFLGDMGERPEGKTLDRIDVNGNYEPTNCRWATTKEQASNKRNTRER